MTDEALLARKHIAQNITKERQDVLYNAGIGTCPSSDQPTVNPSKCNQQARQALWELYCDVADVVNGCEGEQTCTVTVLRRVGIIVYSV